MENIDIDNDIIKGHIPKTTVCLRDEDWGDVKRHLNSIDAHIVTGEGWRKAIVIACMGMIGQLCLIGVVWGEMRYSIQSQKESITELKETTRHLTDIVAQIPVNTDRLDKLERVFFQNIKKVQ